jgi:hypothetical protein
LIISAITRRGHYVNLATTIAANGVAPQTHATLTAGSSILNAIKEHSRGPHDVLVQRLCHDGRNGDHFRKSDSMLSIAVGAPLAYTSITDLMDSISEEKRRNEGELARMMKLAVSYDAKQLTVKLSDVV